MEKHIITITRVVRETYVLEGVMAESETHAEDIAACMFNADECRRLMTRKTLISQSIRAGREKEDNHEKVVDATG